MPSVWTAMRRPGAASISAPTPAAHSASSRVQPTGTARMKRMARGRPPLAASAVDKVVLGPGEKLIAVANTSSAVNSCQFMGHTLNWRPLQYRYRYAYNTPICIGSALDTGGSMLTRTSGLSLTDQLSARFAERIRTRLLAPGARLPSVRECARQQGVSPHTVVAAYDQLLAQGLIEARRQRGFYVRDVSPEPSPVARASA